jgi:hypothetical protein
MGNDSLDAELWFALSACLRVTGAGKEHEHMDTDPWIISSIFSITDIFIKDKCQAEIDTKV